MKWPGGVTRKAMPVAGARSASSGRSSTAVHSIWVWLSSPVYRRVICMLYCCTSMPGRVADKVAIVVGGGQQPGETIGNGRATAVLLAREGARVLVVDRSLELAEETVAMIAAEGFVASACACDATDEASVQAMVATALERYGQVDILHNNVGSSIALGDAPADVLT